MIHLTSPTDSTAVPTDIPEYQPGFQPLRRIYRNRNDKDGFDASLSEVPDLGSLESYDEAIPLIPLHRLLKLPIGKGWNSPDYHAPRDMVLSWAWKYGGNVGIRLTGAGLLVVDIDTKHADAQGRSADEIQRDLQKLLGIDLSNAPFVETPTGGRHIYLRVTPGMRLREKLDALGGAIDFKSTGQVVAAGSVHPDPRDPEAPHYRWGGYWGAILDFPKLDEKGNEISPPPKLSELIPDAPQALVEALKPTKKSSAVADYEEREWHEDEPPERVQEILERHERVRDLYEREALGDYSSDSELDLALANHLAIRGCKGWEIEATLRLSRVQHAAEKEKGDCSFKLTVGKALAWAEEARGIPKDDFAEFIHDPSKSASREEMPATHAWNAARLVEEHGDKLRFVESLNSWYFFDGKRWLIGKGMHARRLAKESARRIFEDALKLSGDAQEGALRWAAKSNMAGGIEGTLTLAKPDLAISTSKLDADPMLLNVQNGTLDLRTHELRPHDPADLITKITPTPYEPGVRCPIWEKFLDEVLPDREVRAFFQRLMGYALQGGQEAKAFGIVHGDPDGGKTTGVDACARAIGAPTKRAQASDDDDSGVVTRHYADGADIETFGAAKRGGGNRPELVHLMGARLVIVNEIKNEALESSVMKAWTGGDLIKGTPKYGHPLGFYADGTVLLVGNDLPQIDFEEDAMWERVVVVPFTVTIPEAKRIRGLKDRFDPRAVLAWMVEGHRRYREMELAPPPACRLAKERHRLAADPLAEFWDDGTVLDPEGRVSREELFSAYLSWAGQNHVPPSQQITRSALTRAANKRAQLTGAFSEMRSGSWRGWRGLRLPESTEEGEG